MCGICGELTFEAGATVDRGTLAAMRDRLFHRGPDDEGLFIGDDGRVGLGFRRLKIIDLSSAANQPLSNEDGSVRVAFNGEIYNYRALRSRLVGGGHQFRSLNVIDLSSAANQPLSNEDGSVRVAFNGEIYNYRALRSRLVGGGHQFRSQSDTEVL